MYCTVQSAQRKLTQQRFYTQIDPFWPTRTSPSQAPVIWPFEGLNLYSFVPNISKPEACMMRIDRAALIQSLGIAKFRKFTPIIAKFTKIRAIMPYNIDNFINPALLALRLWN